MPHLKKEPTEYFPFFFSYKSFHFSKSIDKKMNRLCKLIDLLQRELHKPSHSETNSMDISFEHLLKLKHFSELNSLCALETYHQLQILDFTSIGVVIIKLFQSFKLQIQDLMRFCIMLFKSKGMHFDNEVIMDETEKKNSSGHTDLPKKRQSTNKIN